jgi:beta-mannanase
VSVIVPKTSWNDIATSSWVETDFVGFKGKLSIGLPLNVSDGTSTLKDVANGRHDAQYAAFAHQLVDNQRAASYIRLGWEFNGTWYPWAANDPSAFKAAFRRISSLIKKIDPQAKIEYDGNFGYSQVNHNPFTTLYPGDRYVDLISVDAYDRKWFTVTNDANWQTYLTMTGGLNQWYAFALRRHKPFAVSEWALFKDGSKDNAFYIAKMHAFFAQHASHLAYESYFNASGPDQRSSLHAPVQNPRASKTYAKLWKAQS